ncbi:MAG: rRNA maturation RNAse YbeY [Flavonifractor plautii]
MDRPPTYSPSPCSHPAHSTWTTGRTTRSGLVPWEHGISLGGSPGGGVRPQRGAKPTYLTVHSVLHLLGYDHLDEGP